MAVQNRVSGRHPGASGIAFLLALVPWLGGMTSTFAQDGVPSIGAAVTILSTDQAAPVARKAWEGVPDRADPDLLDTFIDRYPGSAEALEAFSLRYSLVRSTNSIDAYNRFLQRYADRAIAPLAISEVFRLYSLQDTMSGYLDFMRLYPSSTEAVVANLHVQVLAYDFVLSARSVEECDSFLKRFPDAPQFAAVRVLATELATDAERNARKAIETADGGGKSGLDERKSRLLQRATADNLDRINTQEEIGKRVLSCRILRAYEVANSVYGSDDLKFVEDLANLVTLEALKGEIEGIPKLLAKNHEALISTLHQEFGATRQTLEKGFKSVCRGQDDILMQLGKGFEKLNDNVVQVHNDLSAIHATLREVNANVKQANEKLDGLHVDLEKMNGSLANLITVTSEGFGKIHSDISLLRSDVKAGFARQSELQSATLNAIVDFRDMTEQQLTDMTLQMRAGFFDVDTTIGASTTSIDNAIDQAGQPLGPAATILEKLVCPSLAFVPDEGPLLIQALGRYAAGTIPPEVIASLDPSSLLPALRTVPNPIPRIVPLAGGLIDQHWSRQRTRVLEAVKAFPLGDHLSAATLGMPVRSPKELDSFREKVGGEINKPVEVVKKACKFF